MTTEIDMAELFTRLPQVPAGAAFRLHKLERVSTPHPYCIAPKHVTYAADHCCGILSASAIEESERHGGAECEICRKAVQRHKQPRVLRYAEHENPLTLFIAVSQNHDLNAIPGLHAYLLACKDANLGLEGFAFPLKADPATNLGG